TIKMPPVNSAAANGQPISTTRITPSSITRLVEASSNTIAAVKLAPLRNRDRASATAAYEHELEAMPNSVANVRLRGEWSPSRRAMDLWDTTAWTAPERAKPRISGQKTSHAMLKASINAVATALTSCWICMRLPQH